MIKKQYSRALLCVLMCVSQQAKAEVSTTSKVLSTVAIGALGAGGITTVAQWWNMGTRLDELQMCKKVGTLSERNVWVSPYDFTSGYALWGCFTQLSTRKEKDTFRQQLLEEICRAEGIDRNAPNFHLLVSDALDSSLVALQAELNSYAFLTPILLNMAREAGFAKNPQELITSDYIIDHQLVSSTFSAFRFSPVEKAFNEYMDHTLLPIDIKYTWSPTFGTRIPYWFTWTHKKAAECTFEVLKQYSRIRAIQRVMEQYLVPATQAQAINLNLKAR